MGTLNKNVVFVPMCADFIHVGHINILETAAKYGSVSVLLMTDDAMRSYKRAPKMLFAQRKQILQSLRNVDDILPCTGPESYAAMCREHKPAVFLHGDDWKVGPQSNARAEVVALVSVYGGKVIEPAYTEGISSTEFQEAVAVDIKHAKHVGVLVRTILNDLKRDCEVASLETNISAKLLTRLIEGGVFDAVSCDAIVRALHHHYPMSKKHVSVDLDTSTDGVWHMTADATLKSGRVLDRTNSLDETTPYYNYKDTATAALSPFKPELIEQLVHVTDNYPQNPKVVMNRGHLLGQLTFFIGPVNFYCTVRGKKECRVMNTGDTCLITPYVPHSFTSRDPEKYAAIVAVTFSGNVRDVLSDLLHHDIRKCAYFAGNLRNGKSVWSRRVERIAELRGLCSTEALREALEKGTDLDAKTLDEALSGVSFNQADTSACLGKLVSPGFDSSSKVVAAFAKVLGVSTADLAVTELQHDQEVTYATMINPMLDNSRGSCSYRMAESKHMKDCGGYIWHVTKATRMNSQFWSYMYNYGSAAITLEWSRSDKVMNKSTIDPGDSLVIKPFCPVTLAPLNSGTTGKMAVMKVAGCFSQGVMDEISVFAEGGLRGMTTQTTKWW